MKLSSLILALVFGLFVLGCEDENSKESLTVNVIPSKSEIHNGESFQLSTEIDGETSNVEYFLNGESIGKAINPPFELSYTPNDVDAGMVTVTAIASTESGNQFQGETQVLMVLRLGDEFKGGTIFYLDDSGEHGLIAAKEDLETENNDTFFWGPVESLEATDKEYGSSNTTKIAEASEYESHAGFHFKDGLSINGFNDWYIPAQYELDTMKENKKYILNISKESNEARYWSSTEMSEETAYALNMVVLMGTNVRKGLYSYNVRPIRKF